MRKEDGYDIKKFYTLNKVDGSYVYVAEKDGKNV